MPAEFNGKYFNAEVFQRYAESIPNLRRTELLRSGAIRNRQELAAAMSDEVAGNYLSTPLTGLLEGDPVNYDGKTDITASSTETFLHSRIVVGRAKAWEELDFSYDITGGEDFMEVVARQVNDYWNAVDQDTLVSILKGIFSMSDEKGLEFVNKHTYDISGLTNSYGEEGFVDNATLNIAIQRAAGDNKGAFSMAMLHSAVATNLENKKLIAYMKGTDPNGIERDLTLFTWNGRLVMVDDSLPVREIEGSAEVIAVSETKGVYTLTVSAAAVEGDKLEIKLGDTTVVTYLADGAATAAGVAGTLRTMCKGVPAITDLFTVSGSGASVVFTQKVGGTGAAPTVTCTQAESTGTIAASVATTTAGVVAVGARAAVTAHTEYTTFILGNGAIEFTNCGAKVPYEMYRDPAVKGGKDLLFTRQRKCWAPYGISFTKSIMSSLSPTNAELELGANWELVSSAGAVKKYINHRAIPIARIISRG